MSDIGAAVLAWRRGKIDDEAIIGALLTEVERTVAERDGLRDILDGLVEVYKPEGVGVWLTGAHRNFNGDSALDLIREGRTAEVAAEVERLTSGAFS